MFGKAHNTTRKILMAILWLTLACWMGQSTITVWICLCDPEAGKSPAFQHGCAQPVMLHVEAKEDIPSFVYKFTDAGLFCQLKATPGHKTITGKEEVSQFFEQLPGGSRKNNRIDLER